MFITGHATGGLNEHELFEIEDVFLIDWLLEKDVSTNIDDSAIYW